MTIQEGLDPRGGGDEGVGELVVWSMPYHHQQRNLMADDGRQLVRLVANPAIVRHRDPPVGSDGGEPGFIARIGREVVGVALDSEARGPQDGGEASAEVSIGEENTAQAVRSYTTASSTSGRLNP